MIFTIIGYMEKDNQLMPALKGQTERYMEKENQMHTLSVSVLLSLQSEANMDSTKLSELKAFIDQCTLPFSLHLRSLSSASTSRVLVLMKNTKTPKRGVS